MTMKNIITSLVAIAFAATVHAQDNTPPQSATPEPQVSKLDLSLFQPLLTASNWTVCPYITYAPSAPTKFGGGTLIIYNINKVVGGGVGLDWLGHFSLVSGNLTLRYPIDFTLVGHAFTVVPFGIGGLATPYGGAGNNNGGVATIEGAGFVLDPHVTISKAQLAAGAACINWTGAGDYSGQHLEAFVTLHF